MKRNTSFYKKHSTVIMWGSAVLLATLLIITWSWWYSVAKTEKNVLMTQHIEQLSDIFKRIDATASIIGFEHDRNYIDFLNVKDFVGSEVGPMNLRYPDKWEGPYLKDNPTIEEKHYIIAKTKQGYYIVPGDGVKLSNGNVIGKDIIINKDTDMKALIKDQHGLSYEGTPLAKKIKFSHKPDDIKMALIAEGSLPDDE